MNKSRIALGAAAVSAAVLTVNSLSLAAAPKHSHSAHPRLTPAVSATCVAGMPPIMALVLQGGAKVHGRNVTQRTVTITQGHALSRLSYALMQNVAAYGAFNLCSLGSASTSKFPARGHPNLIPTRVYTCSAARPPVIAAVMSDRFETRTGTIATKTTVMAGYAGHLSTGTGPEFIVASGSVHRVNLCTVPLHRVG